MGGPGSGRRSGGGKKVEGRIVNLRRLPVLIYIQYGSRGKYRSQEFIVKKQKWLLR